MKNAEHKYFVHHKNSDGLIIIVKTNPERFQEAVKLILNAYNVKSEIELMPPVISYTFTNMEEVF